MEDSIFFKLYIPAVAKVLEQDTMDEIHGPDRFIENEYSYRQVDEFEQENFERFKDLFEPVALYVDAINHNIAEIEGVPIGNYKEHLSHTLMDYARKFKVKI